jgi:hypothetical protein
MKATAIATLCAAAAFFAADSRPSEAAYATSAYPLCVQSASSATLSCYVRSRAECPQFAICVDNPWYTGPNRQPGDRAQADRAQLSRAQAHHRRHHND